MSVKRAGRAGSVAAWILSIGLMSCATDAVGTASPPPTEATASESASAASPETTAPPELAGSWRRSVEGEEVIITLQGNGYTLQVGARSGAGSIAVAGDRIEFFDSNRCGAGSGFYTWAFEEDGRLRFTEIEVDPCGRADYLPFDTWEAVDP